MHLLTVVYILACNSVLALPANPSTLNGDKIVGGSNIEIEEVPYQLQIEAFSYDEFICGASIINETWALTASHCVYGYSISENLKIRTGSKVLDRWGSQIPIKSVIMHPKYDHKTFDYDVALLELEYPIVFNETSQPITLTDKEPETGELVQVTGWGALWEGGPVYVLLQQLLMPVYDRKACTDTFIDMNKVTTRMFCAGGEEGYDTCQGDSGGPVTLNGKQVGIVSWGYGCAREGYPTMYTNIADPEIKDFIREHTGV